LIKKNHYFLRNKYKHSGKKFLHFKIIPDSQNYKFYKKNQEEAKFYQTL